MMGYLIETSPTKLLKFEVQPAEIRIMGSNPIALLPKNSKFVATQLWLSLSSGSTLYDFPAGAFFGFTGNAGNIICQSASYELQIIQDDNLNQNYLDQASGFKIDKFTLSNQELNLTTITGEDATVGDGVLTIWALGFDLT